MKDVSSKIETVKCVEANETDLSAIFEFSSQETFGLITNINGSNVRIMFRELDGRIRVINPLRHEFAVEGRECILGVGVNGVVYEKNDKRFGSYNYLLTGAGL